ncbi:hypothetical protein SFRURICE_007955 [Spodoptera frugiperda]|nr:hypothetical protein SFRURICE_007955 [Spodoptera frugiperda]
MTEADLSPQQEIFAFRGPMTKIHLLTTRFLLKAVPSSKVAPLPAESPPLRQLCFAIYMVKSAFPDYLLCTKIGDLRKLNGLCGQCENGGGHSS